VETEANQTSGLSQPSPLQQESQKCQACGAAPEPGFPIPLCAKCRSQLARRPIPIGIKLAGVAIALLLVLAVTRIPSSISAAVAFERGQSAEQKLQFASAEHEYQKTVVAYPSPSSPTRAYLSLPFERRMGVSSGASLNSYAIASWI
jgi:hypothetical protein